MERLSSEEEEEIPKTNLHSSINFFTQKNKLSFEEDKKCYRKRSSSMSLNFPKNFVPKLKPIKSIICPSPIKLNEKSPPQQPENQNTSISTTSFDSQNDFSLKPIKYIFSRKKHKKSIKIINIEEETYAVSDCEDNSKKLIIHTNSDTSKSEEEDNNRFLSNKNTFFQNIKLMRVKMTKLRKSFHLNESLFDDSDIENFFKKKRFNESKGLSSSLFINKIKKNKNMFLNPLKPFKYRRKSFNIKQSYVSTILGFLEKNNSTHSLNSNGK